MSVKINRLEIENVKRVRAVALEPGENGLTVIGGRNGQGKTSVLDAIAWALGGNKFRPSEPKLDESALPPEIKLRLSNGLIVQRRGKNAALTVTDPNGVRHGQQLLDSFVEELALDLPRFMNSNDREKADTLLRVLGIGDRLAELERQEKALYNERLAVGRIADQKAKYAKELPAFPDAPEEPVSAAELIRQQQEILARNGENARKRSRRDELARRKEAQAERVERLRAQLADAESELQVIRNDLAIAERDALDLRDESTAALEANIERIDEMNRQVRARLERERAEADAREYQQQYENLSVQIDAKRQERLDLLDGANLPLPELRVEEGALKYRGKSWDCMSGSEQLRVATAIVRRLNPQCGFVLLDRLEQMDADTLRDFGEWLREEGLQAIATRVSSDGRDCTIVIEDGRIADAGAGAKAKPEASATPWTPGEF